MSSYWQTVLSGCRVGARKARARFVGRTLPAMAALAASLSGCVVESEPATEEAPAEDSVGLLLGSGCCGVPPASPSLNGLRLSLTSGLAIPTADVTSAATAYLVPYDSNTIALYDGVAWISRAMTDEASVSNLSTSANTSYDVFAYWDGTKVVLEKDATPVTPTLALQDGVHVKGNDPRRRYVGVVATNASGYFEDSAKNRLVWNRSNQVRRPINGVDLSSWGLSGNNAWREVRNNAANRVKIASGVLSGGVSGASGTYLSAEAVGMCVPATSGANGAYFATGIGIDSTSTNSAQIVELAAGTYPSTYAHGYAAYDGYLAPGVHTVHWLEIAMPGSFTCIGYAYSPPFGRLGLNGSVLM